jgi:hypothetical protein
MRMICLFNTSDTTANITSPFVSNASMLCHRNGLHHISKALFISFRYSIHDLQSLTVEDDGGKNSMA